MKKSEKVWPLPVAGGALGAFAALTLAAPMAHADPEDPRLRRHRRRPGEQSISGRRPQPGDPGAARAAACGGAAPVQSREPASRHHGCSARTGQGRGTSYLRDLWHAVQTQDISGKDALLLLTQRPLDANAMPTNGLPAGPQARCPRRTAGLRCPGRRLLRRQTDCHRRTGLPPRSRTARGGRSCHRRTGRATRPGAARPGATGADAVDLRRWRPR